MTVLTNPLQYWTVLEFNNLFCFQSTIFEMKMTLENLVLLTLITNTLVIDLLYNHLLWVYTLRQHRITGWNSCGVLSLQNHKNPLQKISLTHVGHDVHPNLPKVVFWWSSHRQRCWQFLCNRSYCRVCWQCILCRLRLIVTNLQLMFLAINNDRCDLLIKKEQNRSQQCRYDTQWDEVPMWHYPTWIDNPSSAAIIHKDSLCLS